MARESIAAEFNPLFARLVDDGDDSLRGMIVYGLYKKSKREWMREFEANQERAPTVDEARAYSAMWTDQVIANAQDAAESTLSEYASEAIAIAKPGIVQEALRGRWWASMLSSMGANLAYTVLLLAFVIVLKFMGIDIISALQAIPSHHGS